MHVMANANRCFFPVTLYLALLRLKGLRARFLIILQSVSVVSCLPFDALLNSPIYLPLHILLYSDRNVVERNNPPQKTLSVSRCLDVFC